MQLLSPGELIRTGPVDHADWNFRPFLGAIQRKRFQLIGRLLGQQRFGQLLEIGYGSGIFIPELARRARHVAGVDIHEHHREVMDVLARKGVPSNLHQASMTAMPFDDNTFECAVSVSAMEFVDDIEAAAREIWRVLKPGGQFLFVTPGQSPVLDFGLWLLTSKSAKDDFAGRRERVVPTLLRHFECVEEIKAPRVGNSLVCLYRAFRLQKPGGDRMNRATRNETLVTSGRG